MRIRNKNRSAFGAMNKEFRESARVYLLEAFPNSDRAGCPPDSLLRPLAFHPSESDATVTEHLAACSPCFKRYSELLAELKAQQELEKSPWIRAYAWSKAHPLLAGTVLVCTLFLAVGVGFLLRGARRPSVPPMETHNPRPAQPQNPTVAYAPFSLDLTALSPVRGAGSSQDAHRRLAFPSSALDLTVTLPMASREGPYDLKLTLEGRTLWSKSATAHLEKGKTLIRVETDLRRIPAGNYNLEVQSSKGIRFVQPVTVQAASSKSWEQRQ
jgi:hypothetical protein